MSDRTQLFRLLLIDYKLHSNKNATTEELRKYLDAELSTNSMELVPITKATVKTDIDKLRKEYGMNIQFSFQSNSYFYADQNQSFLNLSTELLQNLRYAIRTQLASQNRKSYFQWQSSPVSIPDLGIVNDILRAIVDRHKIEFSYRPVNSKRNFHYNIDPLSFVQYRNAWHLRGINNADGKIQDYTLHRIVSEILISNISFTYPETEIHAPTQPSFASLSTRASTILIDCDTAHRAWFFEHPIHPSQKVVHNNKRGLRLSLSIVIDNSLISKLLSLTSLAEVVSPAILRVHLYEELNKMIEQYSYSRA